jgi:hypothetical protein
MGWCLESHMWGATPCIKIEPKSRGLDQPCDFRRHDSFTIVLSINYKLSRDFAASAKVYRTHALGKVRAEGR